MDVTASQTITPSWVKRALSSVCGDVTDARDRFLYLHLTLNHKLIFLSSCILDNSIFIMLDARSQNGAKNLLL
jgi:hypothetical protein